MVLAWQSSPRDVIATAAFNVGVGAATAWALVATTTVLDGLFSAVPTPDRVMAALPALVWLAVALVARGACSALAGRAQARLEPQVVVTAEERFMADATHVELASFDDSNFHDHLFRCYMRGCDEGVFGRIGRGFRRDSIALGPVFLLGARHYAGAPERTFRTAAGKPKGAKILVLVREGPTIVTLSIEASDRPSAALLYNPRRFNTTRLKGAERSITFVSCDKGSHPHNLTQFNGAFLVDGTRCVGVEVQVDHPDMPQVDAVGDDADVREPLVVLARGVPEIPAARHLAQPFKRKRAPAKLAFGSNRRSSYRPRHTARGVRSLARTRVDCRR